MQAALEWLSSLYKISSAQTEEDEWAAWMEMINPLLPKTLKVTGKIKEFPPVFQSPTDICLILCNHISDIDQMIIMAKAAKQKEQKIPMKLTGFTYESFRFLPGVGSQVGSRFVHLRPKESEEDLKAKIKYILDQGYNTWLLFPEGTLMNQKTYQKSLDFQIGVEKIPKKEILHHVLYPRVGALKAFFALASSRITSIVDLTLEYQDLCPRTVPPSFTVNPRAIYSVFYGLKSPSLHVKIHMLNDKEREQLAQTTDTNKGWLIKLWKQKDRRLRRKEALRFHKSS